MDEAGDLRFMFTGWYAWCVSADRMESLSWLDFCVLAVQSKGLISKCSGIRAYGGCLGWVGIGSGVMYVKGRLSVTYVLFSTVSHYVVDL